jgi:hypothetical protein
LIHSEYDVQDTLAKLQMFLLEPGNTYLRVIQDDILPPYIVVRSIYKDEYFKSTVVDTLQVLGYDKSCKILKPLVNEVADLKDNTIQRTECVVPNT